MKRTTNLSSSLEHGLSAYALAASAAGVGLLALAQPAEAKIVYTPANTRIKTSQHLYIDLNHDGINDLYLSNFLSGASGGLQGSVVNQGNEIWGYGREGRVPFASALYAGVRIGRHGRFQQNKFFEMATWSDSSGNWRSSGQWWNVKHRYLGLKFIIKGRIHYGWARLSTKSDCPCHTGFTTTTLTGYAYETIPNKPIIAGKTHGRDVITLQPATLGHLAQGASAISSWRRTGGNR